MNALLTPTRPVRNQDAATIVSRKLLVTWQHPESRAILPIAVLVKTDSKFTFNYLKSAQHIPDFRPLLGFPELSDRYESDALFPLFAQRAMDPRRPDFNRYVSTLGLQADATPWEQIARSGGDRAGDTLQLLPVPQRRNGTWHCSFLVHGIRHIPDKPRNVYGEPVAVTRSSLEVALGTLERGDELVVVPEPDNNYNKNARLLLTQSGVPIGYLPDLLLDDIAQIEETADIQATVQVINGPSAPAHVRLMCELTVTNAPQAFQFFDSDKWELFN